MSELKPFYDVFVYHDKCTDGLVSVAIATQIGLGRIAPNPVLVPADYSKELDTEMFRNKRVVFLDFSCKKKRMLELLDVAEFITVIDHHVSVYEELSTIDNPRFKYVYNVNLSGAQLAWQYFVRRHEPVFIAMIGDRDLWTKKYTHSDVLNLALRTNEVGYDEMYQHITMLINNLPPPVKDIDDDIIMPGPDETTTDWVMSGIEYKKHHDYMVAQVASHAFDERLDDDSDTEVLKVNCPLGLFSDVGALLAKRSPSGVAWMYYQTGENTINSLRVSDTSDYDAAEFATAQGGGGHKKAAGWTVSRWKVVPMPDVILNARKDGVPKNPLM